MGAGASAGLHSGISSASQDDVTQMIASLPEDLRARLGSALTASDNGAQRNEKSAEEIAMEEAFAAMFAHKGPYEEQDFGPAPDYSKPESWFHYGEDGDAGAETVVDGESKPPAEERPADCFYIHETSYLGDLWNQPLSDATPTDATNFYLATGPSALNGSCRMYVPRFRQANLAAMGHPEDGRKAVDTAYEDVKAAFEHLLKERNDGRPLVIASHSQGSLYCMRLLQDYVEGKPLYKQLVAVYAIAAWVPVSMFEGDIAVFKDVKLCKASDSVGCVISFTCETPDIADAHGQVKEKGEFEDWYPQTGHKCGNEWRRAEGEAIVGTNPLTWSSNGMGTGTPEAWLGMLDLCKDNVVTGDGPLKSIDSIMELCMSPVSAGLKLNSLRKLHSNELNDIVEKATVHEKSGDLVVGPLPAENVGSSCEQGSSEQINFWLWYFNIRSNLAIRVKALKAA